MSTTTNLGLFKHDDPTTNEDQFDVEKSLNENWNKLDANAGEVANKIQTLENTTNEKDTLQDTEIEALKEENTLLKSQIPSATVVGETIHLEDSSNMPCQIIPLGASKQETREGYNLVDFSSKGNFENDILTISGDTAYKSLSYDITDTYITNPGKTLYFSYESIDLSNANIGMVQLIIQKTDGTVTYNSLMDRHGGLILHTIPSDTSDISKVTLGVYANNSSTSGITYTTVITKPMLAFEENLPYEKYGASPSIEYEAPIESVGDNINLFDKDNANILNGYITDSKFQKGNDYRTLYIPCEANETYAISKVVSSRFIIATSEEMPASQVPITDYQRIDNATELTITTSSNAKYLLVQFRSTSDTLTEEEIINSIKICKGTSAGAYSPYGQGSIEIYNSNENWFDKNKISTAIGGVSGYVASDYISAKIGDKIAKSNSTTLYFYDSSKTLIQGVSNWKTGTIVIENTAYVRCNVLETEVDTFMLVKNQDLPSEYVQSKTQTKVLYTQQPFRAIGDVKDRFVKVDGVWYEKHNFAETIFNGVASDTISSLVLVTSTTGDDLLAVAFNIKGSKSYGATTLDEAYLYCNILSKKILGSTTDSENEENVRFYEGIAKHSANGIQYVISIKKSRLTSKNLTGIAEFFGENPATIIYPLATPTRIECTPEQVEVLESFNTYKNVTNISSDSIGELEVTYSKDLETLYNNLSQAVLGGN